MSGVWLRVLVGLTALLVLAAACGDDPSVAAGPTGTGSAGSTGDTAANGDTDPGAGNLYGGDKGGSTGSTGSTAGEADVSVSVNNYLFDPGTVKVASGDVVAVRNGNTRTPHTFTVVDEVVDLELAPLATETVTIDLAAGTYDLVCRFHRSLGMTGTLRVT